MRVTTFGRYGVYEPYDSHDGPVEWTVQRIECNAEPEEDGEVLGEFREQHDAELFAEAKLEDDDAARMDNLRDKYEDE